MIGFRIVVIAFILNLPIVILVTQIQIEVKDRSIKNSSRTVTPLCKNRSIGTLVNKAEYSITK